jgi:peroxiredoxin
MRHFILALTVFLIAPASASPAEAQRIEKAYQTALEAWNSQLASTTSQEAYDKVIATRPDATAAARQIWENIGSSLDQEWTIPAAAWFLRTTPNLLATHAEGAVSPIFMSQIEAIRKAVDTHHLKSMKLMPICLALASVPDPRSLNLLEKIQSSHPDPKTQGVAALGASVQLKSLGDDGDLMRKRLSYLRKAIIESSEVEINGTTVSKLAQDELYIIQFLSKGRVSPDLVGQDAAGRALSLSSFKGQVVILLFWNSKMTDAKRVMDITTGISEKFKGKPLTIIGVNNDATAKLRALIADEVVAWPNFSDPQNLLAGQYRVGTWPRVYVLDGERKIHYVGPPGSFAELTAAALLAEIKPTATQ